MITTALIIAGAILTVIAVLVFVLNVARAPEGLEDEAGFHSLKEPVTGRSRYYCAKTEVPRSDKTVKPFKEHIPAA